MFFKLVIIFCQVYWILGNHHLVPLIIPPDTVESLDLLSSDECRQQCGILANNDHVFASTKGSEDHTSGWHSLDRVKRKLDLKEPEKIKSTTNRHRLSTILASMDIPAKDREYFYKHMGHSEKINSTIYQAPLAVKEITNVGKHILNIDEGRLF